ncbi:MULTISPECIES: hypothetical protein [Pseudoalteromonas]|uniref:hypothetical protein n=1 Tax=Pseudoalteromonas TaxID=53246 RepID=UPI001583A6B8|nr:MULTISPECIES: hypothetical protein [Pseudoalteromonas]MDI4654228.1 hypothetical protein [Pseudoalteromonas shioyasakiensis]NUJ40182.1 hypothetical protein [Pseudoalteromonas sp. 0303]
MLSAIVMHSPVTFTQKIRGNEFTLKKLNDGQWEMTVMNASVKAYRNGFAVPKVFPSLKEVEAKYKSWRGFSLIVDSLTESYNEGVE